jgi:Zn finger protein HypA/HybF involved in hydrogenase expression
MRTFGILVCVVALGAIVLPVVAAPPTGMLSFPLKGVTKDNAADAQSALAKLERNGFRCTTCDYFVKEAGECPACKTALVAEKAGLLLKDAKIDAEKGIATFGVAGPYGVRFSEIEAALKPIGIEVDRKTFFVAPFTRLTLTGIDSEDAAKTLENAFKDAKLFDSIKTDVSVEHKMAILIVGNAKIPPTLETIETAVEKAGPFKIAEISWTAACPKCAGKGMKHAGCMSCWEKGA